MNVNWLRFAEIVNGHQNFLLTSHIRPDCDALGSELGMAGVLDSLGKSVRIMNGHPTPPTLAFMDPTNRIEVLNTASDFSAFHNVEVLMILDTSAWAQLGSMADVVRSLACKKVIVDHHVGEDDIGAEVFKDTTAEAAGRLVLDAALHLNVRLTREIATPLFAAIATDTGWFRFGSASSGTYEAAAKLIDAGADPAAIFQTLYEHETLGRVLLRGEILSRIRTELEGRLAYTHVEKSDFSRVGALPSDTEDAVNNLLAIAGTQVAVIFVEQATGGFKISFRSRSEVDCSKLAQQFGGGGHKAAAGAFVAGDLDLVETNVLAVVRAAMRE